MPSRHHDDTPPATTGSEEKRRRRALVAPSPYLTITTESDASGGVVHARGELDLSTVLPFREAVFAVLGARPPSLLLELTGVSAIDSTGVSTLLTIVRVADMVRIPVRVLPSGTLRSVLEVTGLNQQMPLLHVGVEAAPP